jgi:hypothetical protein
MIEVFKTDVVQLNEANEIIRKLLEHFPAYAINFDLEDCDNILRVKGDDIDAKLIIEILSNNNYICEILLP